MTDMEVILKELRDFRQESKESLGVIKEEMVKMSARMDEAEVRIEKAEERIQNAEKAVAEMLKLQVKLEDKLLDLEKRLRRDNVRIYGVPDMAKDSSIMSEFVEKLLREGLEIPQSEECRSH